MTQTVAGRKLADKSSETMLDNVNAATQGANALFMSTSSTIFKAAQEYNTKVIEFVRLNTDATFGYFEEMAGAKSPTEFIEVTTKHGRHQFEVLTQQTMELTALAQKLAHESAGSVRNVATKS
jgi:hypothetical protein